MHFDVSWTGGIFFPDAWYDACDEMGVLIYHDMQYAQEGHSPANDTAQVRLEPRVRHCVTD